jgi:hypothetical protein
MTVKERVSKSTYLVIAYKTEASQVNADEKAWPTEAQT